MMLTRRVSSSFSQIVGFAKKSFTSYKLPRHPSYSPSFTFGIHFFYCPNEVGIFAPQRKNVFYSRRRLILQNQQLLNSLHLQRGRTRLIVLLATAYSNRLLKETFRQLHLRCRIFWFLVERKRLYSVHKVSCGDLHLFSLHNLVNSSTLIRLSKWHFVSW